MMLAIFDVDGTLVDSQAEIAAGMKHAFEQQGWPVPLRSELLSVIGLSLPGAIAALHPSASREALARAVEDYKTFYDTARRKNAASQSPLFPGALEALARLNARSEMLLGIATGKSRRGLNALLDTLDLRSYFVTTQSADEHPSKPHPSMIEACLNETGVEASSAVIVGDTSFDMEMGRAAGVHTIGVGWGYHSADRLSPHADIIVRDFDALDAAVEALLEPAS